MISFKEKTKRICKYFWLGSGSRKEGGAQPEPGNGAAAGAEGM